jgi:hypothetical protein
MDRPLTALEEPPLPIIPLYAAALAVLFIPLSVQVITARRCGDRRPSGPGNPRNPEEP